MKRFKLVVIFLVVLSLLFSQLASSALLSVQNKQKYYLSCAYDTKNKLRQCIRSNDTYSDIDKILQNDELANYHTFINPDYRQVKLAHRHIMNILEKPLKNCVNYRSKFFPADIPVPLLLSLIKERIDIRENSFKRLFTTTFLSIHDDLQTYLATWQVMKSSSNVSIAEMIDLERQILPAASMNLSDSLSRKLLKNILAYNQSISRQVESLPLYEKIQYFLFQSYLYSSLHKEKLSLQAFHEASVLISSWIKQEKKTVEKLIEKFETNYQEYKDVQTYKKIALTALMVGVAAGGIAIQSNIKFYGPDAQAHATSAMSNMVTNMSNSMNQLGTELSRNTAQLNTKYFEEKDRISKDTLTAASLHYFLPVPMILELIPKVERLFIVSDDYQEASRLIEIYFNYADSLRGSIGDSKTRKMFQRKMSQMYKDAVQCALHTGDKELLFNIVEKYSSKTLFDLMVSEKTTSKENAVLISSTSGQKNTQQVSHDKSMRGTQHVTDKNMIKDYEDFSGIINANTMTYKNALEFFKKKKVSYAKIIVLNKKIAVLKFDNDIFSLKSIKVNRGESDSFVRQFNQHINRGASKSNLSSFLHNNRIASFLSKQLFGSDQKILVVSDNFTSRFPVTALMKNNKYLIEERPVFYQVSLSVDRHIARKKPGRIRSTSNCASFGNPDRKGKYCKLPNLVYAEKESRYVASTLGGQLFLRHDATKEKLKQALAAKDIVHIASHSAFVPRHPLNSIIIIPSKQQSPALAAGELYNTPIKSRTIILSSCESGAVKQTKGNEINGFVRPLLAHSVKNILMARVPIGDQSSYVFMKAVIDSYKRTKDMPRSFQAAIKQMLSDGKFSKPVFWSPFVLFSAI